MAAVAAGVRDAACVPDRRGGTSIRRNMAQDQWPLCLVRLALHH